MQLYFWLVHFFLIFIYLIIFQEKHKQLFYSELLILLFLPIAGFFLLVYSRWLRWKTYRFGVDEDKLEHLNQLLEHEENTETLSSPIKYSNDVVALNDVLYLTDVADKRKLLTTAIRQATLADSSILKRAIRDTDREVSHYAVSIAANNLSIMEKQIFLMESQWETNCNDRAYLKEYEKLLQNYIVLNVLEENTLKKLKNRYKDVLLRVFSIEDDGYFLEKLVNLLLTERNFEEAEHIINNFNSRNSEQEQGYLLLLKIYIMQKRHTDVQKLLEQLKASRVRFSPEGMKLIRFWSLGASHG